MQALTRRVVITGMGIVSPIGTSKESFWQALIEGRSGVQQMENAEFAAGQIRDFQGKIEDFGELDADKKKYIRKAIKLMSRQTQLAVAAAQHAIADCQLNFAESDRERVGICFGAGNVALLPEDFLEGVRNCSDEHNVFHFERWGKDGLTQVDPLWLLRCLPNMPACHIAIANDFRGPNNSITQREASANMAVSEAAAFILDGEADVVITGSTGTTIPAIHRIHAMAEMDVAVGEQPERLCRPFDQERSGTVMGEGAASFVLEDYDSAVRRGAKIYGEIVAAGSSCVVERNGRPRCETALINAMRAALKHARISAADLGHIHAHGSSTRRSDADEARAIRAVFGEHADKIPLVAAKSHMGNAGAGSGALEMAASVLALQHKRLFPVLNYEHADPECRVNPVKAGTVEAKDNFINLNLVSQGQASCVIIRRAA